MARKDTKAGIKKRLERALKSIDARSEKYSNIPLSGYELKQQESYAKKTPNLFNGKAVERKVEKMMDFAHNQYKHRRQQLIDTANRMMATAAGGGG